MEKQILKDRNNEQLTQTFIMKTFQKNDWQYLFAFGAAVWFLTQIIFRY